VTGCCVAHGLAAGRQRDRRKSFFLTHAHTIDAMVVRGPFTTSVSNQDPPIHAVAFADGVEGMERIQLTYSLRPIEPRNIAPKKIHTAACSQTYW